MCHPICCKNTQLTYAACLCEASTRGEESLRRKWTIEQCKFFNTVFLKHFRYLEKKRREIAIGSREKKEDGDQTIREKILHISDKNGFVQYI